MGNPFSVTTGGSFSDGFASAVGDEYSSPTSSGFDFDLGLGDMFPKIPGVSTGGGSLDLGGGGPSSNHSTTNNQNGFSGGTLNMGSSFGIPTWAILVAGCVAAYLVLKK